MFRRFAAFALVSALMPVVVSTAAAQAGLELSLQPNARIGVVFKSEVGRMAGNTAVEDSLVETSVAQAEQTLRRHGYHHVVPRAEVVKLLIDSGVECPDGVQACPPSVVLSTLQSELDAVVLLAIWATRDPADITVEVVTPEAYGVARGRVDADNVHTRVPALVAEALRDVKNGRAVDLTVNSLPVGAEVRLDGAILGITPLSTKAMPGPHEVILVHLNYVTTSKRFDVLRGGADPLILHIRMERTSIAAARTAEVPLPPPTDDGPSVWNYIIGGGLAVAGAVLVATPVIALAQDGECQGSVVSGGTCDGGVFGLSSGLALGAGILSLAAGTYFLIATPIRTSISTDGDRVHANLYATF